MNTKILSTFQVFQWFSRKCKSHILQSCPKNVYPVSMRMHSKSLQCKFANQKKTSRGKVSRRSLATIAEKTTWKQRRKVLSSEKRFQILPVITTPVINHLS